MTDSIASRVLRAALFTLVPLAYLSVRFWRPAYWMRYEEDFRISLFCPILMSAVIAVSVFSWRTHRVVAVFGLVASFLWFVYWIAASY